MCKDRPLVVGQHVALINKIKHHAFCLGIEVKNPRKKNLKKLKDGPKLELLIKQFGDTDAIIGKY